ncbi:MAG: hypothetical protein E7L06_07030 [Schaalia turicensis]|nr:hypothetical protein [Schaalia turicensis]
MTGRSPRPRKRAQRAQPQVVRTETLEIAGITITVLRKTGLKNMYLRVKPPLGNAVITAPRGVPKRALHDFTLAHLAIIECGRERIEWQLRDAPLLHHRRDSLPVGGAPPRSKSPSKDQNAHRKQPGTFTDKQSAPPTKLFHVFYVFLMLTSTFK